MTYTTSTINNKKYKVRNVEDKQIAADILSQIEINFSKIIEYLKLNQYSFSKSINDYTKRLTDKIPKTVISEKPYYSLGTSYSLGKGQSIVFCIRDKNGKIHDMNLIMYVALHELSHIACPEYGHGDLFKEIFFFIAKTAVTLRIYELTNYETSPKEYCGIQISSSII